MSIFVFGNKSVAMDKVSIPITINLNVNASKVKFLITPDNEDAPLPKGIDINNEIEFRNLPSGESKLEIEFENITEPLVHKYRLRQVNLGYSEWAYDDTEYIFTLYVLRGENNDLIPNVRIMRLDKNGNPHTDEEGNILEEYKLDSAIFKNTYHSVYIPPDSGNPSNPTGDVNKDPSKDGNEDPSKDKDPSIKDIFENIGEEILPDTGDISKLLPVLVCMLSGSLILIIISINRRKK